MIIVEQRNYFKKGDEVEIFGPNHEPINFIIDEIYDEDNNEIDIVRHPRQIVKIGIKKEVYPYDLIRIKKSKKMIWQKIKSVVLFDRFVIKKYEVILCLTRKKFI